MPRARRKPTRRSARQTTFFRLAHPREPPPPPPPDAQGRAAAQRDIAGRVAAAADDRALRAARRGRQVGPVRAGARDGGAHVEYIGVVGASPRSGTSTIAAAVAAQLAASGKATLLLDWTSSCQLSEFFALGAESTKSGVFRLFHIPMASSGEDDVLAMDRIVRSFRPELVAEEPAKVALVSGNRALARWEARARELVDAIDPAASDVAKLDVLVGRSALQTVLARVCKEHGFGAVVMDVGPAETALARLALANCTNVKVALRCDGSAQLDAVNLFVQHLAPWRTRLMREWILLQEVLEKNRQNASSSASTMHAVTGPFSLDPLLVNDLDESSDDGEAIVLDVTATLRDNFREHFTDGLLETCVFCPNSPALETAAPAERLAVLGAFAGSWETVELPMDPLFRLIERR